MNRNSFSNSSNLPMQFTQPQNPLSNNIFQSGNFENEQYQLFYNNPIETVQKGNTSFLAYLRENNSVNVGPFLLQVSTSSNKFGEPFMMDFKLLDKDVCITGDSSKIFQFNDFQSKFESMLSSKNIIIKNNIENFQDFSKLIYEDQSIKFQVLQLPFQSLNISSNVKMKNSKTESGSQTSLDQEKRDTSKDELLDMMKQEIQLLKDQNQLLKHQLQTRSTEVNPPSRKEYVVRKSSFSTKTSRNPSATSTLIQLESLTDEPLMKGNSNMIPFGPPITEKNDPAFHEILQEYMIENEALREQNNSLNEVRMRHNSELEFVFKQNQHLSEKVKELSQQLKGISQKSLANSSPEIPHPRNILPNEKHMEYQNQGYPIIAEKFRNGNDKHSYLRQYDSLKQKIQTDFTKKDLSDKIKKSPEKLINNSSKPDLDQTVSKNDSLREELGRIDNTIKEHIRQTSLSDTLRNMGTKYNTRKMNKTN